MVDSLDAAHGASDDGRVASVPRCPEGIGTAQGTKHLVGHVFEPSSANGKGGDGIRPDRPYAMPDTSRQFVALTAPDHLLFDRCRTTNPRRPAQVVDVALVLDPVDLMVGR